MIYATKLAMEEIGTDNDWAPGWPTCDGAGSNSGSPCIGRRVGGFDLCMAHLDAEEQERVLQRLSPGGELDVAGTPINADLFALILRAVTGKNESPTFGNVVMSRARFAEGVSFNGVTFIGEAVFAGAEFGGEAGFGSARFHERARFDGAQFRMGASFGGARFDRDARFDRAQFYSNAGFRSTRFGGYAEFSSSEFNGNAGFHNAEFTGDALFSGAVFNNDARFASARFASPAKFSSVKFVREALFSGAKFSREALFGDAEFSGQAIFDQAEFGGDAEFDRAHFNGVVKFVGTRFNNQALFSNSQFSARAQFDRAQFARDARYNNVQFAWDAGFKHTAFNRDAWFRKVHFIGNADFSGTRIVGRAQFGGAEFDGEARFDQVQCRQDVILTNARFGAAASLGPFASRALELSEATFVRPAVIEVVARRVSCANATWQAGVTLRLRYAEIDLERATFSEPSFVAGADQPFGLTGVQLDESEVLRHMKEGRVESADRWTPVLTSLRGADASNLCVTDIDMSRCRFAGARLLDQLRLEGRCVFDYPPKGLCRGRTWPPAWHWSRRQILAEERAWRTDRKYVGWTADQPGDATVIRPERLAGLYRQLRKAQEDAKNEPGAADFYYGEMEMRRHATATPAAERGILWLYWLISGYGLRALRSLALLGILGLIVATALVGWGVAESTNPQRLTGTVITTPGSPSRIDATLKEPVSRLPPASQRWTGPRIITALEVTVESMVFRSTTEPLTSTGTWITIAARIVGPVLLALSLLAVRGRVKR